MRDACAHNGPRAATPCGRSRRGFTLIELMLAGVIASFVMGAVSMSLAQLARAKTSTHRQLEAHLRADAALTLLRRDLGNVLRDTDLFWSRVLLTDDGQSSRAGYLDRDEILVFNTRLRAIRDLDFIGDGSEFETHFRVEEDDYGPVLWVRRDAVPDQYELGGGVATPVVSGIVSLSIEAFDGELWHSQWDSDYDGIPHALRVNVVASGCNDGEDPFDAPMAILRTVIPLDRVPLPVPPVPEEPEEGEEGADGVDGTDPNGQTPEGGTDDGGGGAPGGIQVPGGSSTPAPPTSPDSTGSTRTAT